MKCQNHEISKKMWTNREAAEPFKNGQPQLQRQKSWHLISIIVHIRDDSNEISSIIMF